MQSVGVVKYWELVATFPNEVCFIHRLATWEDGSQAFHEVAQNGALKATLYAVSKGNRIATWQHGEP